MSDKEREARASEARERRENQNALGSIFREKSREIRVPMVPTGLMGNVKGNNRALTDEEAREMGIVIQRADRAIDPNASEDGKKGRKKSAISTHNQATKEWQNLPMGQTRVSYVEETRHRITFLPQPKANSVAAEKWAGNLGIAAPFSAPRKLFRSEEVPTQCIGSVLRNTSMGLRFDFGSEGIKVQRDKDQEDYLSENPLDIPAKVMLHLYLDADYGREINVSTLAQLSYLPKWKIGLGEPDREYMMGETLKIRRDSWVREIALVNIAAGMMRDGKAAVGRLIRPDGTVARLIPAGKIRQVGSDMVQVATGFQIGTLIGAAGATPTKRTVETLIGAPKGFVDSLGEAKQTSHLDLFGKDEWTYLLTVHFQDSTSKTVEYTTLGQARRLAIQYLKEPVGMSAEHGRTKQKMAGQSTALVIASCSIKIKDGEKAKPLHTRSELAGSYFDPEKNGMVDLWEFDCDSEGNALDSSPATLRRDILLRQGEILPIDPVVKARDKQVMARSAPPKLGKGGRMDRVTGSAQGPMTRLDGTSHPGYRATVKMLGKDRVVGANPRKASPIQGV